MKIVGWLKRKARQWLLDDGNNNLECVVPIGSKSEVAVFRIVSSNGMYLVGTTQRGACQRLIGMGDAVDQERWRAIWQRLNHGATVRWGE